MKIVAVVGSESGCGKTTIACRILEAVPGLGAVKISPRQGEARVEWGPGGPGKDTSRFAVSGAVQVARIAAPRERVRELWPKVAREFAGLPAVVVEGAGGLGLSLERFVVFVAGVALGTRAARDEQLLAAADVVLVTQPAAGPARPVTAALLRGLRPGVPVLQEALRGGIADETGRLTRMVREFVVVRDAEGETG